MPEFCFETINWSPYLSGGLSGASSGSDAPDLPRLVRAAAAAGFEWISFDGTILDAYCAQGGSLASLRRLVENEGLRTLAIHALTLGADPVAAAAQCRPLAEAAEALGAPYVQAGSIAPLGPALFEATDIAARILREAGAALAIEFLPFIEIASIEQTRELLRATETAAGGLVVDTWHFFHGPDDWAELEGLSADEIVYLQFDDHPPLQSQDLLFETTQRRVYPGEGTFALPRFVATMQSIGFDGIVGLELLSAAHRARPVEEVAHTLLEKSRRFWNDPAPA